MYYSFQKLDTPTPLSSPVPRSPFPVPPSNWWNTVFMELEHEQYAVDNYRWLKLVVMRVKHECESQDSGGLCDVPMTEN